MNYTVNRKRYETVDGFVFQSKKTGIISKVLYLRRPEMIDNYEVIPEPVIEEEEVEEKDGNT